MPDPYKRSILTVELAQVLQKRGKTLQDLSRKPLVFPPRIVQRIVQSLTDVRTLPALNREEIITLVDTLKLSQEEYTHIFAALLALGVQRLMLDYLPPERAWEIAEEVKLAVFEKETRDPTISQDFLTRRVPSEQAVSQPVATDPLEKALSCYDEGGRLSALGALVGSEDGHVLLAQAQVYMQRALDLLDRLPPSIRAGEEWQFWRDQAQERLVEIEDELV